MTDTLRNIAQADTPSVVNVPEGWSGLIMWMVGRFGSGILLALACGWALGRVYEDHAKQTDRLMVILERRASVDSEMTAALLQLRTALDEVSREARTAHNRQ